MFSAFERMVAFRYLRARRQEGFISVIALFSLLGILLGVGTLIVVMSVMGGFREQLLTRILGLQPHVVVQDASGPLVDYDALADKVRAVKGVETAAPIIKAEVLARSERNITGALVYGVKAEDLARKSLVFDSIQPPDAMERYARGEGVILGYRLAAKLGLGVGSSVNLISPEVTATAFGSVPRARAYDVVGTFNVDMSEYDSSFIFMPLRLAQVHFKLPNAVTAIDVTVDEPDRVRELRPALAQVLPPGMRMVDWQQINATYFSVLQVEQNVMFVILALIVVVAAFNIIAGLIMVVKEKGRDIAVLRTMGATRGMILRIFFMNGASIGFAGTILGVAAGIAFAMNIESIRRGVESLFGTRLFPQEFYFLTNLPAKIDPTEVIIVVVMALGLSFIATIYPAWRAARLDPVEALRYE